MFRLAPPTALFGALVLMLCPVGAQSPCPEEVLLDHFRLHFLGVTTHTDDTSTWSYKMEWDGTPPEPGHLTIQLCPQAQLLASDPPAFLIGYDGSTGIYGIKWEFGEGEFPANTPVGFTFLLDKPYAVDVVKFAAKAGPNPNLGLICGASEDCDLVATPMVQDLVCILADPCTCRTELSWSNPVDYSGILILVDGHLLEELPGNSESFTFNLSQPGAHEVCVIGRRNGMDSDNACCLVTCPDGAPLPPTGLMCTSDGSECNFTVTWTNPGPYALLELLLDGVLLQSLPGDATSAVVPGPLTGPHEICISGETLCGEALPQVCCQVECEIPAPLPVSDLSCSLLDICTCELRVTWQNPEEDYDSLRIHLDGVLVETLPGTATSVLLILTEPGEHSICVTPVREEISAEQSCCMVECDEFPALPPVSLTCGVSSPPNCEVELTWSNASEYGILEISLDGVVVETLPGDAELATVLLPGPGEYSICVGGQTICGEPLPEVCCAVNCPGPPAEILDLNCPLADLCQCLVNLSWTNAESDYDEIQLSIDGLLHQVLPGNIESLAVTLPEPGSVLICLLPVRSGLPANPTCCSVQCTAVPALPPSGLSCVPEPESCSVAVSWVNQSQYESLEVRVDGILVATLPGDAQEVILDSLDGPHEVCLTGETICGEALPPVCCETDCANAPPHSINDLECNLLDPCGCPVELNWTNPDSDYDQIQVIMDGEIVASLAGSETSYSTALLESGDHILCVVPIKNGASAPQVCCTVTCPETAPISPVILVCAVDEVQCVVSMSWLNQSSYENLQVFLNGVMVQLLPGDAVETTIPLLLPGENEICLAGQTVCGEGVDPACCEVFCEIPELSDTEFLCGTLKGGSVGDVEATPGASVPVDFFYIDPTSNLQGYSLAICFDCTLFGIDGSFSVEDTIVEAIGAEFIGQNVDNNRDDGDGCEFVVGVLLDALPPFDGQTLPPTALPLSIGSFEFFVPEEACPACLA
ncbi:MAG: hypothetical protein V3T77_09325, partial [Planctomycetota bacterium]